MEKRDNKYLYGLTIVLAVAVVGLSVAYAALSTTLNAQFNVVTQSSASWGIAFTTGTVPGTKSNTVSSDLTTIVCGDATVSNVSVTVADTTLAKPGDTCTYALTINNTGTLGAKLAEILYTKPDASCTTSGASMVCGDITYKLATNATGTTLLATNSLLNASSNLPVWLVISYTGADVNPSGAALSGAKFALVYNQN